MAIKQSIQQFHEQINLDNKSGKKQELIYHGITVQNILDRKKIAIKIQNFHYRILSCQVYYPIPSALKKEVEWKELDERESFYLLSEMKDLALQSLYLLNIPCGECIVQRNGKKSISVVRITSRSNLQPSQQEEEEILGAINASKQVRYLSFGADVEVMVRKLATKKWVNAASLVAKHGSIGYDSAIALHNHRVTHPVLELRPKYGYSGEELYTNLIREYNKLEDSLRERKLEAIGGSNPFGRYLLGGHFHLGNQPLTFKHVQVLDQYLALPFALIGDERDATRRQQYGRLGNVRKNLFQGFEYRTLPSWYHHIPSMLPMLNWLEYLSRHSKDLPCKPLNNRFIQAYYEDEKINLYEWFNELKQQCKDYMNHENFETIAVPFFEWIESQL